MLGTTPNSWHETKGCISAKPFIPVKVTTPSATIVDQILYKAKRLKQTIKFKTVFLSPDRSLEQRETHRQLVLDLKKKALEEPSKKHDMKNGTIVSVEKPAI